MVASFPASTSTMPLNVLICTGVFALLPFCPVPCTPWLFQPSAQTVPSLFTNMLFW
jgi:hypothetical protein